MCEVPHTLGWATALAPDMLAAIDGVLQPANDLATGVEMCAIIGNCFTSGDIMCGRAYIGGKLKGLRQ